MKRSRYKEGPLTDAAMREWLEFEARQMGLDPNNLSERERKLLEAIAAAERAVEPTVNTIRAPEPTKRKRFKAPPSKKKMVPDDAPTHRRWSDKRRS